MATIESLDPKLFKNKFLKDQLRLNIRNAKWFFASGDRDHAIRLLKNDAMMRVDGCSQKGNPEANDWIKDCGTQDQVCWAVNEILVLFDILGASGQAIN